MALHNLVAPHWIRFEYEHHMNRRFRVNIMRGFPFNVSIVSIRNDITISADHENCEREKSSQITVYKNVWYLVNLRVLRGEGDRADLHSENWYRNGGDDDDTKSSKKK